MTSQPVINVRDISHTSFQGRVVVGSSLDWFLLKGGNPEDLLSHDAYVLKSAGSSTNALVDMEAAEPNEASESAFVKEYRVKDAFHSLKYIFVKHGAQVAWETSWHLLGHGVPVPRPQGYLTKKKGPFYTKGYFFAEALSECESLGTFLRIPEGFPSKLDVQALMDALAQEIASLHKAGVAHGDLKWSNILIHNKNHRLWFVDLDASSILTPPLGLSHLGRDLARFLMYGFQTGVDQTMMNRFLDEYARSRDLNRQCIENSVVSVLRKLHKRHSGVPEEQIRQVIRVY
jgi:hypothetical protein